MGSLPPLLSFPLMVVSGWVYRHQLIVIDFLQAENRLLKERLRGKRILYLANSCSCGDRQLKEPVAMLLPNVMSERSARWP